MYDFFFKGTFYQFMETYACPICDIAIILTIIWAVKRISKR